MDNYDPNKNYTFTDKDGNTFTSKGDNGYVWQSITEGTPISVNSNGEWYIEPYIESDGRSVTVHMPEWFKGTNEYAEWNDKYSYLLSSMDLTNDNISQMNDLLKGYGSQGAFRLTSKNELAKYNITDPDIQNKAFNDLLQIQAEANGVRDAQLNDIFGSDENESVADVARAFQKISKEDLSRTMTKMYTILKNHSTATNITPESQKEAADAYTLVKLLNMVDDNPTLFGKDKEFEGLLQASGLQKFNAMVNSDVDVLTQGIAAVPARLLYGILNAFAGKGFDANLTSGTDWATDPYVGANLEGTEGWIQAGSVMGLTTNIAETIGISILLGGAVSNLGMTMAAGSGGAIAAIGSFMQTVPGSMVTDFILHDTPIDLLQFLTDASAYDWDWGKAWNNPEQKQNFIGIPVVGDIISAQFGKVDAGLKNNLIGDAVVDLSIPIISIGKGAVSDGFDQATHGAYTRLKDNIALSNMKVQNWLADIPVLGDGWKRFVNHMMGAENAQFIREARRQAVDDWDIDIYRDAHNKLTLKNHYGAEAVGPMFDSILKKYDIPTTVKNFQVESVKYGGMGETVIKWKEIDKKTLKTVVKSKTVPDLLPKQVKQGLLDIERLGELKGQAGALGGIITDTSSEKEIAELEKRIAELPEKIKAFGDKMIAANKDLEKVGVLLGISNEEWVDALQADEKWAKYMTRQSIVPGYGMEGVTGSSKPLNAKQLTESRKGYYDAEKYLDPYLSMNMKAVALGKAYAWNEQAKMVVAMQISKGSVIAGKASPEIAKRLAEVKAEIKSIGEYRTKLGYDETITRVTKDTDTISNVFREINSTLDLPRQLSLKSVYVNNTTPQNIKNLTDNFNGGQIKFADDVRENVGLDEGSAAAVIRNTYKFDGTGDVKHAEVKTNIVEEPPVVPKVETPEVPETPKVEVPETPKVETPEVPKVETPTETPDLPRISEQRAKAITNAERTLQENLDGNIWFDSEMEPLIKKGLVKRIDDDYGDPILVIKDNPTLEELEEIYEHQLKYADVDDIEDGKFQQVDFESIRNMNLDQPNLLGEQSTHIPTDSMDGGKTNVGYGMTDRGVPYRFEMQGDTITKIDRVTDYEEIAESVNGLTGTYNISTDTVSKMGEEFTFAINRAVLFYKNNFPVLETKSSFSLVTLADNTYAQCVGYTSLSVDDSGHLVSKDTPVQFNHKFFDAGKENSTLQSIRSDVAQTFHPKNTTDLSNISIHESGHAMTWKLTVAEINRRIDEGTYYIKDMSYGELANMFYDERTKMQEEVIFAALEKLGIKNDGNHVNLNKARHTISRYATAPGKAYAVKNSETIAEAFTDYAFNNSNSSKFTLAIMDEFKKRLARFSQAGSPNLVMKENGLDIPAKMFDGNEYAFPTNVKSGDQKSEWLNKWRQKNPYLKGEMTEETYKKANLWDTFFEKEAKAYSANAKTEAPEVLIKKNADFLDSYSKNAAERMINQIKAASIDGFDTNIATLALSHNGADTAKALNEFIIGRIDRAANEIAAKMEGGATMDNIIKAKFTLWDDLNIKNSMKNMAQTLIPDVSNGQVAEQIDNLFDTQLKGMGTLDALPVDAKELITLRDELSEKLFKENNYAKKVGKKADQALSDYRGEVSQVIRYREGGEDVYVVVNDPVVAEMLKKPNDFKNTGTTVETIAQVSNFIARTYRLGTTGANPVAFITNVLRDPVQAVYQGGWNPVNMVLSPEAYYRTLRHYGLDDATITEVTQKLQTWAKSGTMTQEIRNMGGDTPGSIGYRSKSEKFAKDFNRVMTGNKLIEVAEMPLEGWEKMFRNQIGMQSFEKNYRRTRDVNKALSAAMFDASNATTNFSHAVGIFKRATSTIPYLSSAINGTASFWRMFNIDPLGMIMRIGGGFVIPALALTAWNLSSEERRKAYLNLPEWYRQGHITLVGEDGDIYALPIPDELEQFYGTARKLMEFTNEATPYAIPTILAQGMFGFLPVEVDGFFADDGSINIGRGFAQLGSGLIPQAVTMAYELWAEQDLYTGQDLSNYEWYNKTLNALTNVFGTGFASAINSIGMMCGASEKLLVGKSYADTLARNLFGLGFDSATQQFMEMIGKETTVDANGKETKATGLFAENEKLQNQIATINKQMAYASDSEKEELRKQKQELIEKFTTRVKNLTENYMNLFHQTGGLETWKKKKIVSLLNLGKYVSSGEEGSYQMYDTEGAALDEYALARQRYVQAGLPAGPDMSSLVTNNSGNLTNSLELQAAVDKFYGVNKQAGADFKTALETSGLKNVKNEFYDAMQQIYDAADEQGKSPNYDLIEKIQARYLQMFDATLIPIINKYGISVLNDSDFINELRTYVNGMIPSDDWRQSVRNAKKFLSTKDFPTAGVDVKKWLTQRYSSGMRNRNLNSDPEVVNRMMDIKNDLDAGRKGAAKGKIESLKKGIDKANYYISGTDLKILSDYYNMVK